MPTHISNATISCSGFGIISSSNHIPQARNDQPGQPAPVAAACLSACTYTILRVLQANAREFAQCMKVNLNETDAGQKLVVKMSEAQDTSSPSQASNQPFKRPLMNRRECLHKGGHGPYNHVPWGNIRLLERPPNLHTIQLRLPKRTPIRLVPPSRYLVGYIAKGTCALCSLTSAHISLLAREGVYTKERIDREALPTSENGKHECPYASHRLIGNA